MSNNQQQVALQEHTIYHKTLTTVIILHQNDKIMLDKHECTVIVFKNQSYGEKAMISISIIIIVVISIIVLVVGDNAGLRYAE